MYVSWSYCSFLVLLKNGGFGARHDKSMTYASNPGAFMSQNSKSLQSFDAQIK